MQEIVLIKDAQHFRLLFSTHIENVCKNHTQIYLSLSGGIDSSLIFFALIEKCIPFIAVCFTPDIYKSDDFKAAKKMCNHFNVPFLPVYVPVDVHSLYKGAKKVVEYTSKKKKTIIECVYPYLYIYPTLNSGSLLLTGLGLMIYIVMIGGHLFK